MWDFWLKLRHFPQDLLYFPPYISNYMKHIKMYEKLRIKRSFRNLKKWKENWGAVKATKAVKNIIISFWGVSSLTWSAISLLARSVTTMVKFFLFLFFHRRNWLIRFCRLFTWRGQVQGAMMVHQPKPSHAPAGRDGPKLGCLSVFLYVRPTNQMKLKLGILYFLLKDLSSLQKSHYYKMFF